VFSGAEDQETVVPKKLASFEAWYADPDNLVNAKMDLALARITGGESCLGIGCRTGEALLRLQRLAKFLTLLGIDIDPENVEYCRKKVAHATNIFVSVGDVLELGFRANSFDCVMLLDVLEHIRNPRLALCEVERAAKKRVGVGPIPFLSGDFEVNQSK
jgi:ubiquinone/menaquinone biosynthesis C-methylase UbiE